MESIIIRRQLDLTKSEFEVRPFRLILATAPAAASSSCATVTTTTTAAAGAAFVVQAVIEIFVNVRVSRSGLI